MSLSTGEIIAGKYRLERLLGEGGMGSVWEAEHLRTRKRVALKFLHTGPMRSPEAARRFVREAQAASAVLHPNVVQIHDIFELDDSSPVMVMDLLLGEPLGSRLERDARLSLTEVVGIMLPVLSALEAAHAAGVIHRDLKPDNIFLEHTPNGLTPRLLDFGIAKLRQRPGERPIDTFKLTNTGAIMGTPYYMAPEQVFGESDIDSRADIWALGIILYECLSGMRPVDGANIGQLLKAITMGTIRPLADVAPDLPVAVTLLVTRMLSTNRAERPSSAREVAEALVEIRDGCSDNDPLWRGHIHPATARSAPPAARSAGSIGSGAAASADSSASHRRFSTAWLWVAVGVALIATGIATGVFMTRQAHESTASASAVPHPIAAGPTAAVDAPLVEISPSVSDSGVDFEPSPASPPRPPAQVAIAAKRTPVPEVPIALPSNTATSNSAAPAKEPSRLPGGAVSTTPF